MTRFQPKRGKIMNNVIAEKSKLGITSIALFLLNVLLITVFLIGQFLVMPIQSLSMQFIYFIPFIALIGAITGIIALFTKRAWAGLVLNLLLIGFIFIFIWMFTTCCAPPPNRF
jgi:hypothetical protein